MACNLSSINIGAYVQNPYTDHASLDYLSLTNDIPYIVEAMDDILSENLKNHALPEQRAMAEKYRNIGIGIMGLADALIKLGITYGSGKAVEFTKALMRTLFRHSLLASVNLAKKRGNFPGYSSDIWDAEIVSEAFSDSEIDMLKDGGYLRNCSLLSIAPTGSIGTMLNISTGCEPEFMLSYKRRTESLNGKETWYDVDIPVVEEYRRITGNTELPDYFITAEQIDWRRRINMQSAMQQYCDTAISSTINLPATTTVEDVKQLYMYGWESGLKGLTIYVSGSRDAILSADVTKPKEEKAYQKRPKELEADFHLIKANGEQFIVLVGLLEGKPYEIFAFKPNIQINIPNHKGIITKESKMHYTFKSDTLTIPNLELANSAVEEKATTLYASMLLRHNAGIKYIVKTARKVNNIVTSFTSAVCRVLNKYLPSSEIEAKCPECGSTIINEGGCLHCNQCGWSKCE